LSFEKAKWETKYFETQFLEEKYQIVGSDCTPCGTGKDASESEGGLYTLCGIHKF